MKISIIVQNLKCGGCAKTITTKLSSLESISQVNVDIASSRVSFVHENSNAALMDLQQKSGQLDKGHAADFWLYISFSNSSIVL